MTDEQVINSANEATAQVSDGMDVVVETATYAVTREPSVDGKPGKLGFSRLKEGNALSKSISAGELELLQQVEVSTPVASTIAGISQIVADEDEAVSIFNKGAAQKSLTRLYSYFTEVDSATGELVHADETSFDASEFVSEPLKRRNLSELQRAVRDLRKLDPGVMAEALKAMGISI